MNRSDFELFPIRIGRVSYLIRYVLLLVAAVVASIMLEMAPFASSAVRIPMSAGAVVLLIFTLLCLFRAILFPRLRDVGWNTAWALLVLVPIVNVLFVVALLFVPAGDVEELPAPGAGVTS
ncbi:MAG: DUF805 domain-containing protein [Chthoniobacteraceae bacterium]